MSPAAELQAQAGSKPVVQFDSSSFHQSIRSGAGAVDPVVPEEVWMLPSDASYLMWVELENGRLNLLEQDADGSLVVRKRIPVSIGKQGIGKNREGDQKTPIGTYRLTNFLNDGQLDDFYGAGAYPLNYPNALDLRADRTGHGIWLHGLPKNVMERPFLASDGCVVIDNQSLKDLADIVDTGVTQIVLSRHPIKWVPMSAQEEKRLSLERALLAWEEAWERRDNEAYLGFYADDFSDTLRNKAGWAAYKRRVNDGKAYIRLQLSQMSMLVDPVARDLVTVRYLQDYDSNDYDWRGWKEQVWRQGENGWEIIYEGNG